MEADGETVGAESNDRSLPLRCTARSALEVRTSGERTESCPGGRKVQRVELLVAEVVLKSSGVVSDRFMWM